MTAVSRVILFDIDGTLIHSARAGVRGMNAAFLNLYGVAGALDAVPLAGRTDRAIVSEGLRAIGQEPTTEAVQRLRDVYLEQLPVELAKPLPGSCVLPGVLGVLDALASRDDVLVGLLTGNFERGAAIKLEHFQLWPRFSFGAFGDEHVNRRDLVPIAMAHVARTGASVPASRVVVIGDTPADVDCARAHGARSVGVTTGPYSRDDLTAAEADLVVATLEDVEGFVGWLETGQR